MNINPPLERFSHRTDWNTSWGSSFYPYLTRPQKRYGSWLHTVRIVWFTCIRYISSILTWPKFVNLVKITFSIKILGENSLLWNVPWRCTFYICLPLREKLSPPTELITEEFRVGIGPEIKSFQLISMRHPSIRVSFYHCYCFCILKLRIRYYSLSILTFLWTVSIRAELQCLSV